MSVSIGGKVYNTSFVEWALGGALPSRMVDGTTLGRFTGLLLVAAQDASFQAMFCAAWARCQDEAVSPDDVLPILLKEAGIPAYPSVTAAQIRTILDRKWDTWREAGSPQAVIDQLALAGFPGASIVYVFPSGGGYSDGSSVPPYPSSNEWWSSFILTVPVASGGGSGAQNGYSQLVNDAQLATIRKVVSKWKDAQWSAREIVLFETPIANVYDDGETYDSGQLYDQAASRVERFGP